jgi:hypothetical protein
VLGRLARGWAAGATEDSCSCGTFPLPRLLLGVDAARGGRPWYSGVASHYRGLQIQSRWNRGAELRNGWWKLALRGWRLAEIVGVEVGAPWTVTCGGCRGSWRSVDGDSRRVFGAGGHTVY